MRARIDIVRDRGADQDPGEVPAGDRERRVGPAPGPDVRQELPAHLRAGARARRARRWSRSTACSYERPSEASCEPIVSTPTQRERARARRARPLARVHRRSSRSSAWSIVLLVVGLLSSGGSPDAPRRTTADGAAHHKARAPHHATHRATTPARPDAREPTRDRRAVARADRRRVRLPVDDDRQQADPGAGTAARATSTQTFHASRFTITLGNSSVTMFVDGNRAAPWRRSSASDRLLDHEGRPPAR